MNRIGKIASYSLSSTYLLVSFLLTVLSNLVLAQSHETVSENGALFIKLFSADEYKNHDENFAIAQDKRGVMYFGNFGGILEYDGVNWRTIVTTTQTKVSSLYYSRSGTMFVGARDEFGYLYPDKSGKLLFKSLSNAITSAIGEISRITEYENQIYFISNKKIFILKNNKIKSTSLSEQTQSVYSLDDKIVLVQKNNTIVFMDKLSLKFTGQISTGLKDIVDIIPLNSTTNLLFTQESGIYKLSGNSVSLFNCASTTLLTNGAVTSVYPYNKNTIAVWSAKKGLLLMNYDGSINRLSNNKEKIENSRVNSIFKDKDSNLWLALDNGLAQLSINSPISQFLASTNNFGSINGIIRYKGKLCLATNKGLFYLENSRFIPINGINIGCWGLLQVNGNLLVASSNGVYLLSSLVSVPQRVNKEYSFCLVQDKRNANKVYVGNRDGLALITFTSNTTSYQQLEKYDDNITTIVCDDAGDIWMESISRGIFRYSPTSGETNNYLYTSPNGELTRVGNHILQSDQGIILYNAKGVFQYNQPVNAFLPSPFLNEKNTKTNFSNKNWYGLIAKDGYNNYWVTRGDDKNIAYYKRTGTLFKKDTIRFLPLSDVSIRAIHTDTNRIVWFGGSEELIRFNLAFKEKNTGPYQAFIRKITSGDSVLFNGFSVSGSLVDKSLDPDGDVVFNSQINDLKFDFSAASYAPNDKLQFQYYLSGFDSDWSDWTIQSTKEYTNLSPGSYTFYVKAKNIYGLESTDSSFTFTVKTPLYERWWAIIFYIFLGGFLLISLIRWRLEKSNRERQQLESLIKERTEEIVDQKLELEHQSEELAAKNDQLEKIDLIVQSINAEVDFSNLFQTILAKFSVIRNMDNGSFLTYDKTSDTFKFKALRGIQDLSAFESIELTLAQAKERYLAQSEEVYEDIFYKNNFQFTPLNNPIDNLNTPKSLLTITIKNEGVIEAFILLENISRSYAFDQRDISMLRNLKEHLIAAYIKTRLLENLENTLNDLKNTQGELIRQEKLASVGQLTKGIVDRILNPLNYVNNFSQSSDDLIDEIIEILEKQKGLLPADTCDDLVVELTMLKNNQEKIQEHSNSTTRILKDMQKLLREKSKDFLETDLNSFIESKARTALQESKVNYKDFAVNLTLNLERNPIRTKLLPYEFGQVVQNLVSNACYTLFEKSKHATGFTPEVLIETKTVKDQVLVRFRDNGKGIPQQEIEKIFSPFFTTKPTSKGTGLGLFMVKDIIETHKGKVEIRSREGEFTELLVTLPTIKTL
ncbi:ATP-binding protein [Spirosoma endbachense]|uniref:histidine kinase n=1 Tax=Spirosoma endbachense TaxID=2666025 RepID=A0A6P1VVX1_9BACT|nr:ATP-binding protein [Spirosoma endbachense]QHV95990.1 hypothetical protein GJR95_13655 [Spirosoma endbachense]